MKTLEITSRTKDHSFTESHILGIPVANLDYQGVVDQILNWATNRENRYVGVCNVHSVTSSAWDVLLANSLRRADLNTADGMPLVWMQNLLGHAKSSRVYGPTLMLKTLEEAARKNLRIAFYGGHPDRMDAFIGNLMSRFRGLNVVEVISPPFRKLTEKEDRRYTRFLIEARPDIIWVGIGCPKQERWMMEHSPKIKGVMVGVGAAFDFHAGAVPQAPGFMQRIGLEWLYRLICEPRRLFKRYLTTNPVFLVRAAGQLIKHWVMRTHYIYPRCRPIWSVNRNTWEAHS